MKVGIQEIFIKGDIYIINLVLFLDKKAVQNKKEKEFVLSFAIKDGKLQMDNAPFAEICSAYGIADTKEIEAMIYHELILYLLEHERQHQWMDPPYKNLRQNLLEIMKEKHLTIADAANKADITEDEIRGILSGDTMTAVTLYKLCLLFGVNTNRMISYDGQTMDTGWEDDSGGAANNPPPPSPFV